jgi:hypothetical protein
VLEAHEAAIAAAFRYLERNAAVARRGAGGAETVRGEGLVGAAFLHRTSRAGDPQLHTHVLVANVVQTPDGRWTALDARALYGHGRTAGYLYQAVLRHDLSRSLGVRWRPVVKGSAEIEGVPDRVVRAFSRRRAEIEHAMAAAGAVGTNGARIAMFATRKTKDRRVRPEALVDEWRERAAILGLDRGRLTQVLDRGRVVEPDDHGWARMFDELAGPGGLTAKRSTFTRQDVLREIAQRLPNGAPAEFVERAAERFLTGGRAVELFAPRDAAERTVAIRRQDGRRGSLPHEPVYSTPELLAIERAILDQALATRGVGDGLALEPVVERALARRPQLSIEQVEMVRRLTTDGDGIAVVVGRAGTGKTTALAAAHEAWTSSDRGAVGCAVARRAAHELEHSAGIPATSVAALLRRGAEAIPRSASSCSTRPGWSARAISLGSLRWRLAGRRSSCSSETIGSCQRSVQAERCARSRSGSIPSC